LTADQRFRSGRRFGRDLLGIGQLQFDAAAQSVHVALHEGIRVATQDRHHHLLAAAAGRIADATGQVPQIVLVHREDRARLRNGGSRGSREHRSGPTQQQGGRQEQGQGAASERQVGHGQGPGP
jgi:hypothetical protein